MGFGIFIHRADSIYADSPATRYQFPKQYLGRAERCVGDWVIYYEPTKVPQSRGYYAVAQVQDIVPDTSAQDMYLALITPGSYLEFAEPVPFNLPDGPAETGLVNAQGGFSGTRQAAVRALSPGDFNRIVSRGTDETDLVLPRVDAATPQLEPFQWNDADQAQFALDDRIRIPTLGSRIVRDRVFRKVVLRAYDARCAVTGIKLINGGGRAEVDAAHIRSVEANGPDIVTNGIALSGTAHWMFDRGMIAVEDDLTISISRQVNDRDSVEGLINRSGRLIGPELARDRPHPAFLAWHRENCFKH
ncbi:HNH endonuclease [Devosia sp.]|uniref:HNH endonuclease n=1 Tax=Devosia sp. TaxID=1871048 RepID=UPI003A8D27B7